MDMANQPVPHTTERVLRLLGLFQSRSVWTGAELTQLLGVTTRTLRRDVERLRALGYPVQAAPGVGGGYRFGRGTAIPPLLLEEDEVVAVTVALQVAARSLRAIGEPAVRALTKLDQVLPPRLRGEAAALTAATDLLLRDGNDLDPAILVALAAAIRDRVRARFDYTSRAGATTQRDVEPYRIVATDRHWYLLAFDLTRQDWRTFRLDRMGAVSASTFRFTPRPAPDATERVREAITHAGDAHQVRVRFTASSALVRSRVPSAYGSTTEISAGVSELATAADDLGWLARRLVTIALDLDAELEVLEPPELATAIADYAQAVAAVIPGR